MQRFLLGSILVSGLLFLIGSCKDMGNEILPPPKPVTAGQSSFSLVPGAVQSTILSGGRPPYAFVSQGNTSVVVPSITADTLKVRAVGVGNSTIIVGDNSFPQLTDTITVSVKEVSVGQPTFTLLVDDSASTTIAGGTPPYSVVSISDPSKARASIVDTTLTIVALNAGSVMIVVGDSFSPQRTDTVSVTIIPRVSFSTDVQPIFTASCVNAGCHPGGGAPFPLQLNQSYARLVGVLATNGIGTCSGDKRVEPLNADASVLVKRIMGTCGLAQMPLGSTPLSSAQIQLIRDWINQGANNN